MGNENLIILNRRKGWQLSFFSEWKLILQVQVVIPLDLIRFSDRAQRKFSSDELLAIEEILSQILNCLFLFEKPNVKDATNELLNQF